MAFRSARRHVQGLVDSLICAGEHVTWPVVICQAVPSTCYLSRLGATIWPPAAGGMLRLVPSSSHLFLDRPRGKSICGPRTTS